MIYSDLGAERGFHTRYFRNARGSGVEWIYAVDYASGSRRWYTHLATPMARSVECLIDDGYSLTPVHAPGKVGAE